MPPVQAPFSRPLYIMSKGAGSKCNLNCTYCYYLEKENLYRGPGSGSNMLMSDQVLEEFIKQYIQAQTTPQVLFTWHGGESLVRNIDFYKKAIRFQRKYARGIRVDNCIQTNGTLINDQWCRFFKENNWLVGVSIDGPREFHDAFRKTKNGSPSWHKVMAGIDMLNKHGVEWNAMAVANSLNADAPAEFYSFFKEIGCHYIQFAPIVERLAGGKLSAAGEDPAAELAPFSVTPEQWGKFLCTLFDLWVKEDVGKYFIQIFDATLANWLGVDGNLCTLGRNCGHAGVIEHNGDVYSCDHFVFPQYKLGNIASSSIFELMNSPRQLAFGQEKEAGLPPQCRQCRYRTLCNGECPKNRFARDNNGNPGLNYLCAGYYRFFEHSAPAMQYMRAEILAGHSPATVMKLYR